MSELKKNVEEIIPIEKEQLDQKKVKLFQRSNLIKKIFTYPFLNKNQKKILKKIKFDELMRINRINASFDKENIFEVFNFNFFYNEIQTLFDVNIKIKRNKVTALIGPSGCGKSTFLRCLNRMNNQISGTFSTGYIYFDSGVNILSKKLTLSYLTSKVGMVFQKPTPFQMNIYENVAFGPRSRGINDKKKLDSIVYESLMSAALWDEVKDKLHLSANLLSGGQQQRLCIARAIALNPEVLLMDESTSGLDPIATSKIEELILKLKKNYTIILVSHNMGQVQRVSDYCAFFYNGRIVEYNTTRAMFTEPKNKKTKDYILGKIA